MEAAVYLLCFLTAAIVSVFLWRGYRRSKSRLLLNASLCFGWLAVSDFLLFVDRILLPEVDLTWWRTGAAIVGMATLLLSMTQEGDGT
jgi:hypothetical protein